MNASIQTFYFITVIIRRPTTLSFVRMRLLYSLAVDPRRARATVVGRVRPRAIRAGKRSCTCVRSLPCVRRLHGYSSLRVHALTAGMRSFAHTAGCLFVALSAGIDHDRATHTWTVNAASKGRIRFVTASLSLAIHLPWPLGFSSPQPRLRARRFNFSVSVVTIRCAPHLYRPHWPGKRHPQ